MSQANVERVIGRLVTDEAFRRRFAADRQQLLDELVALGCELTWCELDVLGELDLVALARFAERIDPRIHKSDLGCPALAKRLQNPRSALRRGRPAARGPRTPGDT